MFVDPSGEVAITTIIIIGSIVVGVLAAGHTAAVSYKYTGSIDWEATVVSGLSWGMMAYTFGMSAYNVYLDFCYYYGHTPVDNITFESSYLNSNYSSAPKGVGNPVKIAGKGSTANSEKGTFVIPKNFNQQMAMAEVKSDPLKGAEHVKVILGDDRWLATKGWIKLQRQVFHPNGGKTTIHFVYNTETKEFDDFKFTK